MNYPSSTEGLRGIGRETYSDPLPVYLHARADGKEDDDDIVAIAEGMLVPRYVTYISQDTLDRVLKPLAAPPVNSVVIAIHTPEDEEEE